MTIRLGMSYRSDYSIPDEKVNRRKNMGELCENGIKLLEKINNDYKASGQEVEKFAIDYNSSNNSLQFAIDDENGRYISFHAMWNEKYFLVFIWADYHTEWSAVEIKPPVKPKKEKENESIVEKYIVN